MIAARAQAAPASCPTRLAAALGVALFACGSAGCDGTAPLSQNTVLRHRFYVSAIETPSMDPPRLSSADGFFVAPFSGATVNEKTWLDIQTQSDLASLVTSIEAAGPAVVFVDPESPSTFNTLARSLNSPEVTSQLDRFETFFRNELAQTEGIMAIYLSPRDLREIFEDAPPRPLIMANALLAPSTLIGALRHEFGHHLLLSGAYRQNSPFAELTSAEISALLREAPVRRWGKRLETLKADPSIEEEVGVERDWLIAQLTFRSLVGEFEAVFLRLETGNFDNSSFERDYLLQVAEKAESNFKSLRGGAFNVSHVSPEAQKRLIQVSELIDVGNKIVEMAKTYANQPAWDPIP